MTERLHFHFSLSCLGEGNGNPLQCSCLENPRDGGPGGLPAMGSYRVGHDRSDLAASAAKNISSSKHYLCFQKISRSKEPQQLHVFLEVNFIFMGASMLSHFSVSDSVQPQRWQPIRLPRPWDSSGKNTGVGCHFLLCSLIN